MQGRPTPGPGRGDLLLTPRMKIDPADPSLHLIKANVIESFKACPLYTRHTVVRYQEPLLPSHEYVLSLPPAMARPRSRLAVGTTPCRRICKVDVAPGVFREWAPGRKARPVLEIGPVGCAPAGMLGLEGILMIRTADDFAREEGGEDLVLVRESLNT